MRRLLLTILVCSLPSPGTAGHNAGVRIDLSPLGPPCGLAAGAAVTMRIDAREMDNVRQIKFEMSWDPAAAIDSVFGTLGAETAAAAFINPGPPFVEDGHADWGMAVFSDEGLTGTGHLADLRFQLAPGVDPATEIAVYLDFLSLGPSFTERDTVRPAPAMVLGNYCDDAGQIRPPELRLQTAVQKAQFSPVGSGQLSDDSVGEIRVSARLFAAGHFRSDAAFTWNIDNLGPGPLYVLADSTAAHIAAGELRQIITSSDWRGNAHILLDAETGAEGQSTTAAIKVCDGTGTPCAEGQVSWESPMTAVFERAAGALPQTWSLEQNFPNPFNTTTAIAFNAPPGPPQWARLEIFNLSGQKIATPFAGLAAAGRHLIYWDARLPSGLPAASGLYIYRLRTAAGERHRALILLR